MIIQEIYFDKPRYKRIEKKGRIFEFKFWDSVDCLGIFHNVSVSEVKEEINRKGKVKEVVELIDSTWCEKDRVSWAMRRLDKMLKAEEDYENDIKSIEEFCKE